MEKSIGGVGAAEQGHMSTLDLVTELVGGTSTCDELGRQAFEFFEASDMTHRLVHGHVIGSHNTVLYVNRHGTAGSGTNPIVPEDLCER